MRPSEPLAVYLGKPTTKEDEMTTPCCTTDELQTCCAPDDKAECCDTQAEAAAAPTACGCN